MKGILIFLIVFGILVFVHEFGHFIVAKKSGILVREFSIGMGPKLFQIKRNPTMYTIRWLPLGGYVRLAGNDDGDHLDPGMSIILQLNKKGEVARIDASGSEVPISGVPLRVTKADLVNDLFITGYENDDEDEEVTYQVDHDATIIGEDKTELIIAPKDTQFQQANIWQKLATNLAGPLMNIILGFVVFLVWTFTVAGPATTTIAKVAAGSAAQQAQIKPGDKLVAVNGEKLANFTDFSDQITRSKGKTLHIEVAHNHQARTVKVKPQAKMSDTKVVYQIGIQAKTDESFTGKLKRGWKTAVDTMGMIFSALGGLIKKFSLNKLSGPVGLYSETSQVSNLGFSYILAFLAMISINLGIVNLVPIPGLDGGKLLLNLIELIRGKPISEKSEIVVQLVGVCLLLVLIVAVTGNDIYRYFIK